jgi:hypothetical protein
MSKDERAYAALVFCSTSSLNGASLADKAQFQARFREALWLQVLLYRSYRPFVHLLEKRPKHA